ncbi:hypothetical protein EF912_26820 [Streptomyces sp. WAC07061]|uniref:hypothetical protein n=1 Tax=Streptomyces sp. WAC07061 TaxID=2487410 RepID=UPI000F7B8DC3|nr:hypothetical protein [Streptomyces sp. WAC07061]RSS47314.1 hypothetical protein EF912_26820 [Streptomyces sp. WAC07061]
MPSTPSPATPEPSEEGDGDDDCERVRRVLALAGFGTSSRAGDGLRVWPAPEGVMVGWVAREVLRPTVRVHAHEDDLSRFTSLTGLHKALRTALAVILRDAGLDVAAHGEHLLAVRPPGPPRAGGEPPGQDPARVRPGGPP